MAFVGRAEVPDQWHVARASVTSPSACRHRPFPHEMPSSAGLNHFPVDAK